MPAGIECFDGQNNLMFAATDYLARSLGTIQIKGADGDGSFSNDDLLTGAPWAMFFSDGTGVPYVTCTVTVSGILVNWKFGSQYANQGNNPSGYILYGVK